MKYLTDKELKFWNALIYDYDIHQDKSFINTLFLGFLQSNEDLKNSLFDMYSTPNFINLFNKSDLLLETQNGVYLCKYKEFFYLADTEGDIRGVGKELQNIPANRINEEIRELTDINGLIEYFKDEYNIDYKDYIEKYKEFCKSFGFEYNEDLSLIEKQSKDFDNLLTNYFKPVF